jgi:hypothetical protein
MLCRYLSLLRFAECSQYYGTVVYKPMYANHLENREMKQTIMLGQMAKDGGYLIIGVFIKQRSTLRENMV